MQEKLVEFTSTVDVCQDYLEDQDFILKKGFKFNLYFDEICCLGVISNIDTSKLCSIRAIITDDVESKIFTGSEFEIKSGPHLLARGRVFEIIELD